jgi:hypothetical protein
LFQILPSFSLAEAFLACIWKNNNKILHIQNITGTPLWCGSQNIGIFREKSVSVSEEFPRKGKPNVHQE